MQENKKIYTVHYPLKDGKDIFNKQDYDIKVVSENDDEAEIILVQKDVPTK